MSKPARTRPPTADRADGDALVDRLRTVIPRAGRSERRMFGGVGFMLNGNMVVGTFRDALLVRVGKDRNAQTLTRPGARAFEMRGRPVEGYVMVEQSSLGGDALKDWVQLALSYVRTLPPKSPNKSEPKAKKGGRKS